MNNPDLVYIALGSNEGNRLEQLQKALFEIESEVGEIITVSPVYESPAWGFQGNAFLNACIAVETCYSAEETIAKLLKIETSLGRVRKSNSGYANRSIDLDILLFENEILDTKDLKIPHPEMEKRKFVLLPLNDIASEAKHPGKNIKIKDLLKATSDDSKIQKIPEKLKIPGKITFPEYGYVAIEGNIGVGKTSFAQLVAREFNAKLVLERFKENPFLSMFYEDQARYAFPLELSFLADRHEQLVKEVGQGSNSIVADYDIFKSLVFAKVTLPQEEFKVYQKIFEQITKALRKPDLYIYLHQNPNRLLKNIKKRGREYEQNIKLAYLERIEKGYLEYIKSKPNLNVKIIDITDLDFVNERKDYLRILGEIKSPRPQRGV